MNKAINNRNIIMKNYVSPSQRIKIVPNAYTHITATIDTCSDAFDIYIKLNNNTIEDIVFSGEGCAVSTASLNILSKYLISMKKDEAIKYIDNYQKFLINNDSNKDILKNLMVFENTYKHGNRIKCALMAPENIKLLIS